MDYKDLGKLDEKELVETIKSAANTLENLLQEAESRHFSVILMSRVNDYSGKKMDLRVHISKKLL